MFRRLYYSVLGFSFLVSAQCETYYWSDSAAAGLMHKSPLNGKGARCYSTDHSDVDLSYSLYFGHAHKGLMYRSKLQLRLWVGVRVYELYEAENSFLGQ
jgi:hypothetical protein